MKKLKLKISSDIGDILTREELKKVFGGSDSGSMTGSNKEKCGTGSTPKIDACKNLRANDKCCFYTYPNGSIDYGKCVSFYGQPLHCSDLN